MRKLLAVLALLPALAYGQAFRVGSGIQVVPRASEPSHNAANGTLWVDSSASNVLKYCNPAGSCITLGSGGGGETLAASYVLGASAADQTLLIQSGDGGPVIFKANGAATGILVRSQTSGGTDLLAITDDAAQTLKSAMADGASAVALNIDTTTAWSNAGARLLKIMTNGVVKSSFNVSGSLIFAVSGAGLEWNSGTNYVGLNAGEAAWHSNIKPDTNASYTSGTSSLRWLEEWTRTVVAGSTSGNQPTCDSTYRGGMYTVNAAGGASDTFQVCMKAAADTYAWRTVFTAP